MTKYIIFFINQLTVNFIHRYLKVFSKLNCVGDENITFEESNRFRN